LDPQPDPRGLSLERGFVTAQWVLVAGFSMLFLALLLNLVAVQYAHGVMRAALDEGLRRGTPAAAGLGECEEAIAEVMEDLLGGPLGAGIGAGCRLEGDEMVAAASGAFPGWFPGIPDFTLGAEVRAVNERDD
jgi:hypothetical protein